MENAAGQDGAFSFGCAPRGALLFYPFETQKTERIVEKMKQTKSIVLVSLLLALLLCLTACFGSTYDTWKDAIYKEDATVGDGATAVRVEICAQDKTVAITLKTDEATLGAALLAENLITGEEGPYGLYVKTVNGILADYDTDHTYWALYIDGEYALTGVDTTPIEAGKVYRLSKDKG